MDPVAKDANVFARPLSSAVDDDGLIDGKAPGPALEKAGWDADKFADASD